MRRWLALSWWCLAGCNQIYGLDKTKVVDASFFDVREDFACPPIGETPMFAASLNQIGPNCAHYSDSAGAGAATAYCDGLIAAGPIAGPFTPLGLEPSGMTELVIPRLAPEGDELFVREYLTPTIRVYRREPTNTFAMSHTVTLQNPAGVVDLRFGTPTRGPLRRMLIGRYGEYASVEEIEIPASGTSTSVRLHTVDDLGIAMILGAPNMTADGLRIVFPARIGDTMTGSNHMMYSDRASLADPFGAARVLDNIPYVSGEAPFLDATCSRIYSTTTGTAGASIVWAQRL